MIKIEYTEEEKAAINSFIKLLCLICKPDEKSISHDLLRTLDIEETIKHILKILNENK